MNFDNFDVYCLIILTHISVGEKPSDDEVNREKYMRLLNMFSGRELQNLRKIEMTEIVGELELDFLKLVLKSKVFLERMIIGISFNSPKQRWRTAEELLDFGPEV